jgi:hypothetical protein
MRIKLIACEVLAREFSYATSTSKHVFDTKLMAFGLHETPDKLRAALQEEIDAAEGQGYGLVMLGYGLCSRGTADLVARSVPIVIPRCHDCITLLLGSRARYNQEFTAHPGTYYYSAGWVERKQGEVNQGFIDSEHEGRYEQRYLEYVEKYGEDNAKFLIEQETQWLQNYNRVAFIDVGLGDVDEYRRFTTELARSRGWNHAEIEGDLSLVTRLAHGEWDSEGFLRVKPGQRIAESFDELVLKSEEHGL